MFTHRSQEKWASYAERPTARMLALMAGATRVALIAVRAKFTRNKERSQRVASGVREAYERLKRV